VPRSAASSTDVRRWVGAAAVGATLAFGLASERIAYGWDRPIRWIPDLIVGLAFVTAGGLALPAARSTGVLLAATGLAWYAGNLDPFALYWHRGPLVHLLLTYPAWRPRSWLGGVGVAFGYVAALGLAWLNDSASITMSLALVAVLIRQRSAAVGLTRQYRTVALQAGMALAAVLVIGGAARLTVPGGEAVLPALWLYEGVLCAIAVGLCVGAQRRPVPAVTDLVVELGETRSGTVRDALAQTLGDPSLQIGYWRPATGDYVDSTGAQVIFLDGAGDRSVRHIEQDGRPYAVLIHDPAVLGDAALARAVEAATRLSTSNEALHSEVRARVAEVAASRRRLVVTADEERRRLEQRLHDGPRWRLARILASLRAFAASTGGDHLRRAAVQLGYTVEELDAIARGLHPRDLVGGLVAALQALADRSPVPVRLAVAAGRFPAEVETAVYYVCAEALANVAKHASATAVSIDITSRYGRLTVIVRDDGVGGADQSQGSGLRGLADRVEALGGRLAIESTPRSGTTLIADISREAHA
jgi:signal transduction histidine kinase